MNAGKALQHFAWVSVSLLAFLLALLYQAQAEVQLGGEFWARGSADLRDDRPEEDLFSEHAYVRSHLRFTLGPRWAGRLGIMLDRLAAHRHGRNREETTLLLGESFLRYQGTRWEITLGHQIIRWGKADEISVLDHLTRQDLRELFTLRQEERQRPWPWLRIRHFGSRLTWEGVFTLWPLWPRRKTVDADWAVFDHLRAQLRAAGLASLFPLRIRKEKPSPGLQHAEFGMRLGGTWGVMDWELSFLHAHSRSFYPYLKRFPLRGLRLEHPGDPWRDLWAQLERLEIASESLLITYPRDEIFGFSFETTWRGWGLRGEVAFHTAQVFLRRDLTSTRRPSWQWVLGADYQMENGLYLNLQLLQQKIVHHSEAILFEHALDSFLFLRLAQGLGHDFLQLRLDGMYGLSTRSWYLNPEVSYKPRDDWELFLGLHLLDGPQGTFLDPYDANDQVYLGLRYNF